MSKTILKNPFVALCGYASQNNWCWNLSCTTCGHGAFKVAFSKLIKGQHPDNDSFWPNGKSNSDLFNEVDNNRDFWRSASITNQLKLSKIVADAKIADIKSISKFPDWLGYIGLVIRHCPNRDASKIISDSFLPQFITLLEGNSKIVEYLQEKEFLGISDLSEIEKEILV